MKLVEGVDYQKEHYVVISWRWSDSPNITEKADIVDFNDALAMAKEIFSLCTESHKLTYFEFEKKFGVRRLC